MVLASSRGIVTVEITGPTEAAAEAIEAFFKAIYNHGHLMTGNTRGLNPWYFMKDNKAMNIYEGKPAGKGTAIGRIQVLNKHAGEVSRETVQDTEKECRRVEEAIGVGQEQLQVLYDKACAEVGEDAAAIFEVHQMLMEDVNFTEAVYNMIRSESINAEYAVALTCNTFADMFASMEDEYFRARSADIKDISGRLVKILSGEDFNDGDSEEPAIIVAYDLTPSETVAMDKTKILAFVTVGGSIQSHTAILARMMNIPALIGVELDLNELKNGTPAIVYGSKGTFICNPDTAECQAAQQQIALEQEQKELLESMRGKENVTKSGKKINIYANIGGVGDCGCVLENDAAGVGLFRSEFLYLGREDFPTEEEQFNAYRSVAQTLGDRPVIIRTLDLGADKKVGYFNMGEEENPALGLRAIRICLTQPEIFKTQLRALLRASIYGNIEIMYPMIASVWEVRKIKAIVQEAASDLTAEGVSYRIPAQGIMIETPAAVIMADELAKEVDFFSVGTNDLTQYTLAADRQNSRLGVFADPHHPAILKMLKMIVDAAHANGIRAGICGELGGDPEWLPKFIEMGLDEISVSPSSVLKLRKMIREMK